MWVRTHVPGVLTMLQMIDFGFWFSDYFVYCIVALLHIVKGYSMLFVSKVLVTNTITSVVLYRSYKI